MRWLIILALMMVGCGNNAEQPAPEEPIRLQVLNTNQNEFDCEMVGRVTLRDVLDGNDMVTVDAFDVNEMAIGTSEFGFLYPPNDGESTPGIASFFELDCSRIRGYRLSIQPRP